MPEHQCSWCGEIFEGYSELCDYCMKRLDEIEESRYELAEAQMAMESETEAINQVS